MARIQKLLATVEMIIKITMITSLIIVKDLNDSTQCLHDFEKEINIPHHTNSPRIMEAMHIQWKPDFKY